MPTDGAERPALRLTNDERGVAATPLRRGNTRPDATPRQTPPIPPRQAPRARLSLVSDDRVVDTVRPLPRSTPDQPLPPPPTPTDAVAAENRSAADHPFDPADPRWILATRAAAALEGGRAAILPPERRARLVSLATSLGLRPFDAHLVIAIVQDDARTGAKPLADTAKHRVALVRAPADPFDAGAFAIRLAIAALIAAAIVLTAIGWLESAPRS